MYFCEKCGSIYFRKKPNICSCGQGEPQWVTNVELSEYMCESCQSRYKKHVDKCENCGSKLIKRVNKKEIINLDNANDYEISDESDDNSFIMMLLRRIKFFSWVVIVCLVVSIIGLHIPNLVGYMKFPKTNSSISLVEKERKEIISQIEMLPVFVFLLVVVNLYLKSKNNYFINHSNKESNWILIKNIDYELIPQRRLTGIKYRILARLVTIGEIAIIKSSKDLFDNPYGEYEMLIDMNNMDNYIIRKSIPLKVK